MFRLRLNELRVKLRIVPDAPLLIKEGRHQWREDPAQPPDKKRRFFHGVGTERSHIERIPRAPNRKDLADRRYDTDNGCFDMAFVYSRTPRGDRFYIPGASLRGVLRSAAERLVGRWQPGWTSFGDPFLHEQRTPDDATHTAEQHYSAVSPVARCFGNTHLRGRWTVEDAWLPDEEQARPRVVVRDGVGISRVTGAAQDSLKYQYETIVPGDRPLAFHTTLTLVNYEQWQLGLLAHLLATLDAGTIRLGYGTRRGLGHVGVRVDELAFRWYVKRERTDDVPTLGWLLTASGSSESARAAWDLHEGAEALKLPMAMRDGPALAPDWLAALPSEEHDSWAGQPWSTFGPLLGAALSNWPPPARPQETL